MNSPDNYVEPNHYVGQVSEYAVIINSYGEILLIQHNGGGDIINKHYGKWHMPGGRLNMDDEPQEGLKREILEEGVPYNQLINAGGWELKFAPPRVDGQLPALIHAMPVK